MLVCPNQYRHAFCCAEQRLFVSASGQRRVHPRGTALRAQYGDRPLLLTTPGSVNWITGGLSDPIDLTSPSDPVWFIESKQGRALITSEIEAPRLEGDFDLEVSAGTC